MNILVCVDGELHTRGAIERAISLGLSRSAEVTGLHVIDPWLKRFYNEIYAQGRKQYLEYVDDCLRENAERARGEFDRMCLSEGLRAGFKVRHGAPFEEILDEARTARPDLLITGRKPLNAWGQLRSGNLPLKLSKKISDPTSMIAIESQGPGSRPVA